MNATEAERKLWKILSARKIAGVRFNRQVPIGPFICDFVSRAAKLIVEVDGGQHVENVDDDQRRTRYLEGHGYRVIRLWNNEVLSNLDGVAMAIENALAHTPSPNPSRKAGGEF